MENSFITQPNYIKNLFNAAWNDFKNHWKIIVLIQLAFVLSRIILQAPGQLGATTIFTFSSSVIFSLVFGFLGLGFIKILLLIIDGKKPEVEDLWRHTTVKQFFAFIGAYILMILIVFGGMVFLIVPGIILSLGLMFYTTAVVDQSKGGWQSLMHSFKITKGFRGKLFLIPLVFLIPLIVAFGLFLIPFVGAYLSLIVFAPTILTIMFVYPFVNVRIYRELQINYESSGDEPNIKTEKVMSIIALVIAPIAALILISVLTVIVQREQVAEQYRQDQIMINENKSNLEGVNVSNQSIIVPDSNILTPDAQ